MIHDTRNIFCFSFFQNQIKSGSGFPLERVSEESDISSDCSHFSSPATPAASRPPWLSPAVCVPPIPPSAKQSSCPWCLHHILSTADSENLAATFIPS